MTKPFALIIEDHKDLGNMFQKALDVAGYETEVIADGAVAQKRLEETVPRLVLLDLHLPGVSGESLLHQIREDVRLSDTRILLATADAALASELDADADVVLLKPVSIAHLSMLASRFR